MVRFLILLLVFAGPVCAGGYGGFWGSLIGPATDLRLNSLGVGTAAPGSAGDVEFSGSLKDIDSSAGYVLLFDGNDDTGIYTAGDGKFTFRLNGVGKFIIGDSTYGHYSIDAKGRAGMFAGRIYSDLAGTGSECEYIGSGAAGNVTWKIRSNNDSGTYDAVEFLGPADPDNGASVSMMRLTTAAVESPLPFKYTSTESGYVFTFNNDNDTGWYWQGAPNNTLRYCYNNNSVVEFTMTHMLCPKALKEYQWFHVDYYGNGSEAYINFAGPPTNPTLRLGANNDSGAYDAMEFLGPADPDNGASVRMMRLTTSGVEIGGDLVIPSGGASVKFPNGTAILNWNGTAEILYKVLRAQKGIRTPAGYGIAIGSSAVPFDNALSLASDTSVGNPPSGEAYIYFDATADQIIAKKSDGTTVVIADFSP